MLDAPQASQRYTRERHSLVRPTLARVLALWGTTPPPGDWDEWFAERGPRMAAVVEAVQPRLIDLSTQAVPQILADTGSSSRAEAAVDASQLIGVAGDGRSITGLLGTAITTARTASDSAALSGAVMELGAAAQGWRAGRLDLMTKLLTVTSDTSRAAMSLETVTRPRVGYTRKLVGSSCARCVVLAGRTYRAADAFDRHPHCDCEHVPAETRFLDLATVDARVHFDGLSRAQQDRLFTKAGAQAIRDGADINQVVNARRGAGLSFASGRITKAEAEAIRNSRGGRARARSVTTEGTTRRGIAGSRLGRGPGGKHPAKQRLMPDAIYQAADGDRDLALELLHDHGYLLDPPTKRPTRGRTGGDGGDEWIKRSRSDVRALTGKYRRHVEEYTGPSHRDINNWLRRSRGDLDAELRPDLRAKVKSLDAVLQKRPTTEPIELTRTVGLDAFKLTRGEDLVKVEGSPRREHGYMSTSRMPDGGNTKDYKKPVRLTVKVPPGTPAAVIEDVSKYAGQGEVLLGRGLKYILVGSRFDPQINMWRATMVITRE
ncbi:ADP-ribosyltransferase [Gordonia sp. SND2]|uniref:ADP-ribosyltransferase n=1 Tax=Gordonia sp. SND2 TaxID=3388659 RepID=UPI00398A6527